MNTKTSKTATTVTPPAPLVLPALPTLDKQTVRLVPTGDIAPSPTQPRKDFNAAEMEELLENIRVNGIRIPLLGRPGKGGKIELVAGERRWRTALKLNLASVPMIVQELSDDDVVRIQRLENAGRENLKALEAAEDYLKLEQAGKTVDEITAMHGVGRAHVFTRKRVAKLPDEIKKFIREGKLSISIADLIAKLPTKQLQLDLTKHATKPHYNGELPSFRDVKEVVDEDYMRTLSGAPWKQADAELVRGAGACTACPKRSGNMAGSESNPYVCTDVKCYEVKQAAHSEQVLQQAKAKGQAVVPPENYRARSYNFEKSTNKPWQDHKKRPMSVLGKMAGVAPSVTVDSDGKAVEVFTPQDKEKIFTFHKFSGYDAKAKAEEKKADAENKAGQAGRRKVVAAVLPQLRGKVETLAGTAKGQLALLRWLATDLEENHLFDCVTDESMAKQTKLETVWGLLALLVCEQADADTHHGYPETLTELCKLIGLDVKAEEKKISAQPKVEPKQKKGGRK